MLLKSALRITLPGPPAVRDCIVALGLRILRSLLQESEHGKPLGNIT